jgi:hypothetical protein
MVTSQTKANIAHAHFAMFTELYYVLRLNMPLTKLRLTVPCSLLRLPEPSSLLTITAHCATITTMQAPGTQSVK